VSFSMSIRDLKGEKSSLFRPTNGSYGSISATPEAKFVHGVSLVKYDYYFFFHVDFIPRDDVW
jgi:hypothetical protein